MCAELMSNQNEIAGRLRKLLIEFKEPTFASDPVVLETGEMVEALNSEQQAAVRR